MKKGKLILMLLMILPPCGSYSEGKTRVGGRDCGMDPIQKDYVTIVRNTIKGGQDNAEKTRL